MTNTSPPDHLLIRAQGQPSPIYAVDSCDPVEPHGPPRNIPLDAAELALPDGLAQQLAEWSQTCPAHKPISAVELRTHQERGLELARALAIYLGPLWAVRFWDEGHSTAKFVCWQCPRLHWVQDAHTNPPAPLHISVEGEYKWHPLRAEGIGDFAPDDPAFSLDLSDELVADLYQWSHDIDANMELYLRERDEASDDARRAELDQRGTKLAERTALELGPGRRVTYGGLA
ncbi:hypothetical protein [Streptomyces sp. NPDC048361]|uniref:hypothetical protein n=1 Tax=Streptomyces sp. NPDC048361 TaxID=3154720 RepID=UPI003430DD07